MIKRYILHIETHWRHLPRISFKRAPRPGDRVKDGGVWGTLRRCSTCGEGFLHEPDPPKKKSRVSPPGPHRWSGRYCIDCENNARFCPYPPPPPKTPLLGVIAAELAKNIQTGREARVRPPRSYHTPRPAMDFNAPEHVELKVTDEETETPDLELRVVPPAEHVELKIDEPAEHVELKVEEESPEELELDYKLGQSKHKRGDILWTHKAEYVVDKLEDDILYLVRKDVWDAREKKAKKAKKAKHVELKFDEPSEHVELKVDDDKPSEIVQLKFE